MVKPLKKKPVDGGFEEFSDSDILDVGGTTTYPPGTTDPVIPAPQAGDRYYNTNIKMDMVYDAGRGKFLSVAESVVQFGRQGNTAAGAYYRGVDRLAMSSTAGRNANFSGTIVGLEYTRSDSDSATFEVTANGITIATLASAALSGQANNLNADFAQNDVLAARNQTGGNTTSNVSGLFRMRWRS